jgi:hypothetical protein
VADKIKTRRALRQARRFRKTPCRKNRCHRARGGRPALDPRHGGSGSCAFVNCSLRSIPSPALWSRTWPRTR